ncbi:MAG: GatB/YqeY domain-containing protein, partial [Bdellovibrionota bacterium]
SDKEKAQLKVVEAYLPKQMSKEDLEKIIADVMKEMNASSVKDMGGVIKGVMAKTAGAADGKLISEIVKSKLS